MASAVATVALLTGCSTENDLENGKEGLASLELSSVSSSDMLTRAVIDGTIFPKDGHIGLFLFKDESAVSPYGDTGCSNVEYSYNGDNGKWTANPPITVGGEPGYLYGYYPYNSSVTDIKSIPVASSLDGDDVMYATKQTVTDETASQTAIKMNHALARVTITVVNNGYTLGEGELSSIKFSGAEASMSGILDATSGIISGTTKADVILDVPSGKQTITAEGTVYECLLVPSEEESLVQTLDLTLNIDGNDKTANLSGDTGITIARNTKSNLTIALSNTGISVQTVSIEDWNVVEVGGYKVTVKLDEGQSELADDIVFTPNIKDGSEIKVVAISLSQKRLECHMEGNASCNTEKKQIEGGSALFNFTISDITSDVTATIGYTRPTEIKLSESSLIVYVGESYNLSATVLPDDTSKKVTWSSSNNSVATVDENGKVTAKAVGTADIIATTEVGGITDTCTVTVKSTEELILPGEFSVDSTKKVRFSRGNLYYDGSRHCIEEHQYDTTPTSNTNRDNNHISHFLWCDNASNAMALIYNDGWNGENKSFFAASGFTVHGFSSWRTLTGGEGGEWEYLLETRTMKYNKPRYTEGFDVSIDGVTCNGLFIYPDDYNGNEIGSGGPDTWADINAAGIVFLPAAGYRNGDSGIDNPAHVIGVGIFGDYWSASPNGSDDDAYGLYFFSGLVNPSNICYRNQASSVRLVTEVE